MPPPSALSLATVAESATSERACALSSRAASVPSKVSWKMRRTMGASACGAPGRAHAAATTRSAASDVPTASAPAAVASSAPASSHGCSIESLRLATLAPGDVDATAICAAFSDAEARACARASPASASTAQLDAYSNAVPANATGFASVAGFSLYTRTYTPPTTSSSLSASNLNEACSARS